MLQEVSIIIGAVVAAFSAAVSIKKEEAYGYALALTFIIYMFYNTAVLVGLRVPQDVAAISFLMASLSALLGIWQLYRSK